MNPPERPAPRPDAGDSPRPANPDPTALFLFGVPFHDVTEDETLEWMADRAKSGRPGHVVTSNLDFVLQAWRDPEMHRIHLEADLVIADGWPPVFFSRFFGPPLRARVAGSDIVPRLGATARDRGLSLFALGGAPGVGERAMGILQERNPGLRVAGCASPPKASLLEMDHQGLRETLAAARPDILLVAFGAPKQEKWIRMNALPVRVPVSIGVGGSLDFIAGAQTRAPRFFQKVGLEWFWRLASQPRRMFKRYFSNIVFLLMILLRLTLARLLPAGRGVPWTSPEAAVLESRGAAVVALPPMPAAPAASAFLSATEPVAAGRFLALDLTGFSWLNSLELGAIARLARAARREGRPLFLVGVSGRARRLLRLLRLDRSVEIQETAEGWLRRLGEVGGTPADRAAGWTEQQGVATVVLPEQFDRDEAERALEELSRRCGDAIREIQVDGRRLRYIDSSGLGFLRRAWAVMGKRPGGSIRLTSFPDFARGILRREGLEFLYSQESRP